MQDAGPGQGPWVPISSSPILPLPTAAEQAQYIKAGGEEWQGGGECVTVPPKRSEKINFVQAPCAHSQQSIVRVIRWKEDRNRIPLAAHCR